MEDKEVKQLDDIAKDRVINIKLRKKYNEFSYFKKNLPFLLLALPGFLILIIFRYFPIYGLVLPFKNFRPSLGFWKSEWCGFENFKYLFHGDGVLTATRNTIFYNVAFISFGIVVGVVLALMLFELSAKFVKVYQTVLFFPYFISWVVGAFIVKALLDMDYGVINNILSLLGKDPILWYNNPRYWPVIITVASLWKGMGQATLMYYAALMGISPEYYEAAKIDGANKFQQIIYISIPMIKNVVIILFILHVGKIMYCDFGLFYNVPMNSSLLYPATDVLDTFVYRSLIDLSDVGMSSAAAFYQSVIGLILVLASNLIAKKVDPESGLF